MGPHVFNFQLKISLGSFSSTLKQIALLDKIMECLRFNIYLEGHMFKEVGNTIVSLSFVS